MRSRDDISARGRRYRDRLLYAAVGAVLGLGAPLGWLLWRLISTQGHWLRPWFGAETGESGGLYLYLAIATVLVFSSFGYLLGSRSDGMIEEADVVRGELDRINEMAFADALTGVRNARYVHEQLSVQMEAARRYRTQLTCVMIDIDDFKNVNDRYGHPFGDTVLAALAKCIVRSVRRVDIVGRLGGEEFMVIMPHTSSSVAYSIAERIRHDVENLSLNAGGVPVSITISLGVAHFPNGSALNKDRLLKKVDDALYSAKRAGKNRTVLASDIADTPSSR